ncbi:hypothetical protein Cni_G24253 [Canna indica]|uniref:Uncharacterized protein n=1 Tax=Canna indica TaxID=4628 RepID=A0AAQ3KXP0_9LILI|nr:hypothetical protein Cni_G24253 [Canna indica]
MVVMEGQSLNVLYIKAFNLTMEYNSKLGDATVNKESLVKYGASADAECWKGLSLYCDASWKDERKAGAGFICLNDKQGVFFFELRFVMLEMLWRLSYVLYGLAWII